MKLPGLDFRAQTRVDGIRVAQLLPAIDHPGFPIDSCNWDRFSPRTPWKRGKAREHFEIAGHPRGLHQKKSRRVTSR